mgnify:CR=1 FL=1
MGVWVGCVCACVCVCVCVWGVGEWDEKSMAKGRRGCREAGQVAGRRGGAQAVACAPHRRLASLAQPAAPSRLGPNRAGSLLALSAL